MGLEDYILTSVILLAAMLYSSVGHGGASGYLAAMALFGLSPDLMRPSALALNIVVAGVATYRYSRVGQQDWRLLTPFVVASVPAAFIGGFVPVPPSAYGLLVGAALVFSAFHLARTARKAPLTDAAARRPPVIPAIFVGAGLGLLSGLTGVGGGIFLSPLILLMGWAGTRTTSGVAAGFILVNSVAGLLGNIISTGIPAELTTSWTLPVWAMAALVGCLIGTNLGTRTLSVPGIRYALALVLIVAAAKMVMSGV